MCARKKDIIQRRQPITTTGMSLRIKQTEESQDTAVIFIHPELSILWL